MRKFKFRAWEEAENKMYKCIVGNSDMNDDEFICPLIWDDKRKEWLHSDTCKIMQYTGVKDLKGQEIYEGDILAHMDYWWIRIEYENGSFMVRDVDKVRYANKICNSHISDFDLTKWRVIGNVYENKELFL